LRQTSTVVFCGVDALIPPRGKINPGFDEFTAALDHAGIPAIWVTTRSRGQMDDPRRRLDHNHPFIAEEGCGVYLPEGYFHLRPAKTVRLGRFTCIPIAEPQPAAREALESLAADTGVSVVTLRSLSARQVMQNSGLPLQDADLARQRDFDELFFFAGASDQDIDRFVAEGRSRNLQLRQHGVLWSLAAGASLNLCIRALSKLYERALRSHPTLLGIATPQESPELFAACDRAILLGNGGPEGSSQPHSSKAREIPFAAPDTWDLVLASLAPRS
jgi:predicted mannosyl-3-phosphoglycerate phosphatase (HAD superfamily)